MKIIQCFLIIIVCVGTVQSWGDIDLPTGSAPQAIEFEHFPSRLHTFVWRNWALVPVERLARVVDTTSDNIQDIADSLGLPEQSPVLPHYKNRIYITLIRRNWHLLPYKQLLELLDMRADELAHSLREDDFLYIKLGSLKPSCEPLLYSPPTSQQLKRCEEIKKIVRDTFSDDFKKPYEEPFHFIKTLSRVNLNSGENVLKDSSRFSPKFVYSYFAIYGDPLMDSNLESYPKGLFQRLAQKGIDGIWIHSVLRQLAPSDIFPEFGKNHEIRIKNLNKLVKRAAKFGISIYLYINEPRAMKEDFFKDRIEMKGVNEGEYFALCTSNPDVRKWLSDSLEFVFTNVSNLGGVFTITASENLTNCASHGHHKDCPHCKSRTAAEIITEVNTAIENGVHKGNPDAKVIVWDWGWRDEIADDIISLLPKSVWLMSVSEWSKAIERGNTKVNVGEYSISVVGPGPRATRHWSLAKKAGLKTVAKMQINNTWEFSAIPYLPVMDLIAQHCANLQEKNVDGLMLSWTLGGYPSPNMKLVQQFDQTPAPTRSKALDELAMFYFGKDGAPFARQAWSEFSTAFQEYPYHGSVVYRNPVQFGPSNLLYLKPTGYRSTMIGFPYDDVDGWRGPYPVENFIRQFQKLSEGWINGLGYLEKAVSLAPVENRSIAQEQLRFARVAGIHFKSVANQSRFTFLRNQLSPNIQDLNEDERSNLKTEMKIIVRDEIDLASQLYALSRQDSRIGFEASNHYYYRPIDLMEKVINCHYILDSHIENSN